MGGSSANELPSDVENVFTGFAGGAEVIIAKILGHDELDYLSGTTLAPVRYTLMETGEKQARRCRTCICCPLQGIRQPPRLGRTTACRLW